MNPINALNPLDGRYQRHTSALAEYFSEKGLIKYRVKTEIEYFKSLMELAPSPACKISEKEKSFLNKIADITEDDALLIKEIETKGKDGIPATNHDVKAVEYFLAGKFAQSTLADRTQWIHFALTSEDINNFSYGLMLSDTLEKEILPKLREIQKTISAFARKHNNSVMLAKTHGQPAVGTTMGKEMAVFSARLNRQISALEKTEVLVKLNGAVGNYNAHYAAFPKVNWINFTKKFVVSFNKGRKIKLAPNLLTTQIEPHDNMAEIFDNMRRINVILTDFARDIWQYVSDEVLVQRQIAGEVGSSTMPQKINPIDFENAEGNLGLANALFGFFAGKLPVSRLQRDLSDSTTQRNIGVAFGYSAIAYASLAKGLGKISFNGEKAKQVLREHPEVIAEGIQTILRREGQKMPYEKLKALTRGKKITLDALREFIDSLPVSAEVKAELKKLSPENYTGIADKIANLEK